jgi:1,4-alpha-glucan branching enzyme
MVLSDPHAVFGAHEHPDGIVVRAYRPDARAVAVVAGDREVVLVARGG